MKTQQRLVQNLIAILFLVVTIACSKDDGPTEEPIEATTFTEVIALGGDNFDDIPPNRTEMVVDTVAIKNQDARTADPNKTERFICTTTKVSILDGNDQFSMFNPNASVIYPGSLLQGKTLENATPSPIVVKRAGGTVSYNIIDGNLNSTFSVDEVSKSSIQDAMNNIINGSVSDGDTDVPGNFSMKIKRIQSKEQLAVELGLKIKSLTTKVDASFSLNKSSDYNSFLIKLNQNYYTMDFDLPTSIDQVFDESVTPAQLATYVQADNPATFISQVTYGRVFYMLFESTSLSTTIESKLSLGYNAIAATGKGKIEFDKFSSLENLSLKVIAYGGNASETIDAVASFTDNNNIGDFLSEVGKSTDIRTGLPLSYEVRSVERPDIVVGSKIATEYDVTQCELKGVLPPGGYSALTDIFKEDEDGGGIGAMVQVAKSNVLIFNKLGSKYVWYNGVTGTIKGTFNITDANSPLGVIPLDNVGAATQLSDVRIYFFDKTGLAANRFKYNKSDAGLGTNGDAPSTPIGVFLDTKENPFTVNDSFGDSDNFPFVNRGFEAGVRTGDTTFGFFGKPGNEYSVYSAGGLWGPIKDNDTWWDSNLNVTGSPTLFDSVSAATYIEFSDSTGRWLFVNGDGSEIMEYQSIPTRKFEGPWVIN
ncbi:thiol-activated cytolysin family protein [Cellulophaga sp. F20128]|uniref:thiol-activated cytolysin family protein n=1 Tax=Cellulophaga sp. F20128 TaxID=2926413 RepID=UPI001FF4E69F|nr:thiol-activated cytolysin family protein [Cellulophaga sp. F20128]MCK0157565.1 thiol-activated cytolysin family protein [Cellulophaga sp. F20128]